MTNDNDSMQLYLSLSCLLQRYTALAASVRPELTSSVRFLRSCHQCRLQPWRLSFELQQPLDHLHVTVPGSYYQRARAFMTAEATLRGVGQEQRHGLSRAEPNRKGEEN